MHMATYISRDFFTELEGFNIEFKDSGDYELFMRALAKELRYEEAAEIRDRMRVLEAKRMAYSEG